jgi:fucose permease
MSKGRVWWVAYAGFLLNGMAVVSLGPLLPRLESLWRLGDGEGGALLAAQFLGMSVGTILVRRERRQAMAVGAWSAWAGLSAVGALVLSGGTGWQVEAVACASLLLFGFGLGQAVTALNLNLGVDAGRASRLSFGNAMWSVGAILGPMTVALALRGGSLGAWLLGFAWVFPVVWLRRFGDGTAGIRSDEASGARTGLGVLAVFGALMFLYGSSESCLSGWVTTFARRAGGAAAMVSPLTTSAFWFGVAGGRGLASVALRGWQERRALLATLAGAAAASLGLLSARGMGSVSLWAALAGMMVGPGFPLIIAGVLDRRASARQIGLVLAMCGLGATAMPLVLGVISERTHSLREALALPGVCLLAMLALVAGFVKSEQAKIR